jgi:type IV secretion system protein VirB6
MNLDVFASLSNNFDPALTGAATRVVSNAIAANAPVLTSALTLYVIVWGLMCAFGQVSLAAMMAASGKAAAISLLMTTAFFLPYIQTPFLTTIPNWIAGVTTGSSTNTAASQFSALWSATLHMEAQIYQQASGIFYIAARLQAGLIAMGIGILLVIDFFVWEIARWLMDVLICVGPFILWFYLFRATRGVPERWFGKMVGILILYALVNVTMEVVITTDISFMASALAESRHRRQSWLVTSDGAERREIAERRPLGDARPISRKDVLANMARNLSRQPEKPSALLFLERAAEAMRQSARGLQSGLRPAEERQRADQQPTTLHRSFARARLRVAARAIKTRVLGAVEIAQAQVRHPKSRTRRPQ